MQKIYFLPHPLLEQECFLEHLFLEQECLDFLEHLFLAQECFSPIILQEDTDVARATPATANAADFKNLAFFIM